MRLLCEAEPMAGAEKVKVVVGDDHPMFREGVVRALVSSGEIEVVAEAEDGLEALELIRSHQPQVALLDYRMPGMSAVMMRGAGLSGISAVVTTMSTSLDCSA